MKLICFLTAFLACTIGKICGLGGGVIIKPVLDALGMFPTDSINFLSGCTVIGMSCWSVLSAFARGKGNEIELDRGTPLAVGAAVGGIAGKSLYSMAAACFSEPDDASGIQTVLLLAAVFLTLIYTIRKDTLPMLQIRNPFLCVLIGFVLGALASFLGVGGGPFNMVVLYFFFSMPTKTAAQNSLYIILIGQSAGILKTVLSGETPEFSVLVLAGMVFFGITGSEIGNRLNRHLTNSSATRLFEVSMVLIMMIAAYNARVLFL